MITKTFAASAIALGAWLAASDANASLTTFQAYTGNYDVSTDGWGSVSQLGIISAFVPNGATVTAAYLYSSLFDATVTPGGTLNGQNVTYSTALGTNLGFLQAWRADVTSIVKPLIDGGLGGQYDFAISETLEAQDGSALVVVYSDPALPTSSIFIVDGFSASGGDTSAISFANPLDPTALGFVAEMRVGDGFSCCGQASTIAVNGATMTDVAGNNDDSADGGATINGDLITMGGSDDPFTIAAPGFPAEVYADDHERYDLKPFINNGDTSISIATLNPSNDDNIFLEVFKVSGEASISNGVPEPSTWAMMLVGFVGIGLVGYRRAKKPATTEREALFAS